MSTGGRLVSLDAFRGLTIAGMILVNNPGTWSAVYRPLTHADWHGWTPTDLIFTFFLFAVGVSIALALAPRLAGDGLEPHANTRYSLLQFALQGLFKRSSGYGRGTTGSPAGGAFQGVAAKPPPTGL